MRESKRIEIELKKRGIKQYKIICITNKSIAFLYKDGNMQPIEEYEDTLEVRFRHKAKFGSFCITSSQPDDVIATVVQDSIENAYYSNTKWGKNNIVYHMSETSEKHSFETNSKDEYEKWLNKEITSIEQQIKKDISLFYKVELSRYILLTNSKCMEEYLNKSTLTCIVEKRKIELCNCGLFSDIAGRVLKQLHKHVPIYKEIYKKGCFLLKGKAVAQFINKYILMYYASYIYEGESFIMQEDIGKRFLEKNVDLSVVPYASIYFDGEGYCMYEKEIIKEGKIIDCLCNSLYSEYMQIDSYGNADLNNPSLISHHRIKFKVEMQEKSIDKGRVIINEFQLLNLDIKKREVTGIAMIEENGEEYCTDICFRVDTFLRNVSGANNLYRWNDNVFCSELYYDY